MGFYVKVIPSGIMKEQFCTLQGLMNHQQPWQQSQHDLSHHNRFSALVTIRKHHYLGRKLLFASVFSTTFLTHRLSCF
jgi:hypothetical protein